VTLTQQALLADLSHFVGEVYGEPAATIVSTLVAVREDF
jgi:hypothetical protein